MGVGDAEILKRAEVLAALSALYQLGRAELVRTTVPAFILNTTNKIPQLGKANAPGPKHNTATLSDKTVIDHDRARYFLDFYCRRFNFDKPDVTCQAQRAKKGTVNGWQALLTVGGNRVGVASAPTKKLAQATAYIDACIYLESCDPSLWEDFKSATKKQDRTLAPQVWLDIDGGLEDTVRDLERGIRQSTLYNNSPKAGSTALKAATTESSSQSRYVQPSPAYHMSKSKRLQDQLQRFRTAPTHAAIRDTRAALPILQEAQSIIEAVEKNDVTVVMAATGSGKTTQLPQIILDHWIDTGKGSACNIVCTQPRRIAAISVATRIAAERGQSIGKTVGYQGFSKS